MKNFKKYLSIVVVALSVIFFNSCNQEEIIIPQSSAVGDTVSNGNLTNTGNTSNNPQGEDGEITLYKVVGDNINKVTDYKVTGQDLEYQKDVAKHNEIWELVKKIVPLKQREKMGEFLIYNGSVTESAGFVVEISDDLSVWKMGIAINYAYEGGFNTNGELAYTIIHEFGHILTLHKDQLDASITKENCTNYFPGEGCARSSSYINELYQAYWKDIANEYQDASASQSTQEAFYEKYQDRYVTQYASTNPGEDIAEVFATFVTRANKPSGTTIAEKKILLMYNRSELVAFRDHIRQNLQLRGRGNSTKFILPEAGKWKQANTFGNPFKTKCKH